jgi:hypothetical protein
MPGNWITNRQVEIYMNAREQGHTQEVGAAKSGISVRSGSDIENNKRSDPKVKERHWRTRQDPLAEVWETELERMLEGAPSLQAITLLEYIQATYPGKYEDKLLRTLQRRVKEWRALKGPDKETMFRQEQIAGRQGLSDFTELKQTTITITGKVFKHLLYHFRLIYSKWSYMKVTMGGESYCALAEGLHEALQRLGGSPLEHRTDSLSAAYKNLGQDEQDDITERYKELCSHYSMKATRNNRGKSHENGGVESPHGHLKRRIEQALLLRGSYDFETVDTYQNFIEEVVQQHNLRNAKALSLEKPLLKRLPTYTAITYTNVRAVISSSSTIDVRRVTYTVPSKLQGETLNVRLYDKRLECFLGSKHVISLERVYPTGKHARSRQVDYRHVIGSLVKKPQAFRYSRLRDDLLPTDNYKMIWDHVDASMSAKAACKFIVGLLYLAHTENCETELAQTIITLMDKEAPLSLSSLQMQFKKSSPQPPEIKISQHDLSQYNCFINQTQLQEQAYV